MDSDNDKTRIIRPNQSSSPPAFPANSQDTDATRIVKPSPHQAIQDPQPYPTPTGMAPPMSQQVNDPDQTRILPRSPNDLAVTDIPLTGRNAGVNRGGEPQVPSPVGDSDKTKLVRTSSGKDNVPVVTGTPSGGPGSSMDDPVVGWLVVIDGPGKGGMVCLGEQDNRIGRGGGSVVPRVCINFGDSGISRSNAFVVRYDPKKGRFKILPGEGANIVYINDDDLDSPTVLKAGDIIEISETKLRFAPFCNEKFNWSDTESDNSEK